MGVGDYVQSNDLRLTESKAAASTGQDNDELLAMRLDRSPAEQRANYRALAIEEGHNSKAA